METAPIDELRRLQVRLLRKQLKRAYENSKYYRVKLKSKGVCPSDVKDLKILEKIAFTTRETLEDNFYEILSVPMHRVATIRQTSGTTGNPLTIAHSKRDLDITADAYARKLTHHGVTSKDIVQVTTSYGLWQGAWSIHSGAEKIGACILSASSGDTERQIRLIKRFGTTVLYGVTNYHFRIAEVAKQLGENLRSSSLRLGICVAEKPTKQQLEELRESLGYKAVMIDYGATEFPGFSVQCRINPEVHHAWSDYYLVEVVDPETHETVQEGERGELVITSLQREAFPLIRYLTGDITSLIGFDECDCGLTHPKISADIDRKDFMVKAKGTSIFPSAIETNLGDYVELTGRCQIIVDKRTPKQDVTLKVETKAELSAMNRELLSNRIERQIKSKIGITIDGISFVPFGTFDDKMKKTLVVQ